MKTCLEVEGSIKSAYGRGEKFAIYINLVNLYGGKVLIEKLQWLKGY